MKVDILTLTKIFAGDVRFLVPLFQRPYVWDQEKQWQPLWEDITTVAERVLADGEEKVSPHFLGAIVVSQKSTRTGDLDVRHVIDGQQRLTTLQLVADAVDEAVREHGPEKESKRLRKLLLNDQELFSGDDLLKVWPTNADQDAFRAVMTDAEHVPEDFVEKHIIRAHAYFKASALEWVGINRDSNGSDRRFAALVTVISRLLRLVVIDLAHTDNAQAIFET